MSTTRPCLNSRVRAFRCHNMLAVYICASYRAQQRFRERQKEKSQQATVQVQKLQRQVAELKARTGAADDRCRLLEKLLALNDGGHAALPADAVVAEKPSRAVRCRFLAPNRLSRRRSRSIISDDAV